MPGDKYPDHTQDIGWSGRLVILAIAAIFAVAAFDWLLV
jgi:hypothetical protein